MSRPMTALPVVLCALLLPVPASAAAQAWKPMDPAHLALQQPKIQADADAETLLWEVRISDDADGGGDVTTTFQHYLRVKIFTDRGREKFATVDIPYASGADVRGVAARTIRPDGSILELKGSDTYRRTLVKANDLKIRAVSFAVPGIDRGVIVEYRWREVYRQSVAANLRLRFSRDVPVHDVRYYVRPLAVPGYSMIAWPFHGQFAPPEHQQDGYTVFRLSDVVADADEAYSVPPFERRPWLFISYEPRGRSQSPAEFWRSFGKLLFDESSKRSKPDAGIRALAAAATAGAGTTEDKLAALVRVARERVRRTDIDTAPAGEVQKAKEAKDASEVLRRGAGTGDELLLLVLALSNAAGLDGRVAAISSRADLFQRSVQAHPYFVRGRLVAVRNGQGWSFADPANEYADRGQLPWEYEGQRALIADRSEPIFAETPMSPKTYSIKKRTGRFRLLEDGTLEGEARVEYTGHWADILREQEDQDAAAEREKALRELVTSRISGAEVMDVRIEHVTDMSGVYSNAFRIRVPGFAQRTGSRLLVRPFVFQKGLEAVFQSTDRKTDVYFPFAWSEEDVVSLDLPPGFAVEEAVMPKRMDVGAASYEPSVRVEGAQLVLRRALVVGGSGLYYDVSAYRPLRAFFDAVHRADGQTVVLQRTEREP